MKTKMQAHHDPDRRITLSERDYERFVARLDDPPPPTAELKLAMRQYLELKAERPEANL